MLTLRLQISGAQTLNHANDAASILFPHHHRHASPKRNDDVQNKDTNLGDHVVDLPIRVADEIFLFTYNA
jgi:hypothetical protein